MAAGVPIHQPTGGEMPPKTPAETADAADFSVATEAIQAARMDGYEEIGRASCRERV